VSLPMAIQGASGINLGHTSVAFRAAGFLGPRHTTSGDAAGNLAQVTVAGGALASGIGMGKAPVALSFIAGVAVIATCALAGMVTMDGLGKVFPRTAWTALTKGRTAVATSA